MYFPPVSGTSVVSEDQGVWAPVEHQRVIAKLTTGLGRLFYQEKAIGLEPLPETMLDEGKVSQVPDLSLRDEVNAQIPIIVEVCHSYGLKGDLQKVIQLIDEDLYGIREGFIYDYRACNWLRYRFGDAGIAEPFSFSDILQLDLNQFLV